MSTTSNKFDILVVEDSATQAEFLAKVLRGAGDYTVRIAVDGNDGLLAARERAPDLIVSDISMPGMDGFTMCREIKRDSTLRNIPLILLTALTSLHDVIRALDCGADNFIRKPFVEDYLLGRIRMILDSRRVRGPQKVQLGMQIELGGQTHFITAERQQIFDLLIATYEEAIQITEQLTTQQQHIMQNYHSLQGLYRLSAALNPVLTESAVGVLALEHILDFPGVTGACIELQGPDGQLRLVTAGDYANPMRSTGSRISKDREPLDQSGTCFPRSASEITSGVLRLLTTNTQLTDDHLQLYETVGNQIAVAIERARLYSNMEMQIKNRTEAWLSERNLLSAVVNATGALVCVADAAGIIRLFNPACEQATGQPAVEAIGRPCWEVFESASGGADLRQFFERADNNVPAQVSGQLRSRDGDNRAIIWSTTFLRNGDGAVEYFLGTGVDVTELRGAEEQVRYLSNFDSLTGLPNRTLMRDRMSQLQGRAASAGQLLGYLVIRSERLRLIGESLGIDAEEIMLRQVARRLARWADGDASVARIGERSFAIAVVRKSPEEFSALAREVLAELSLPFLRDEQELHLEPALGIAVYPSDGEDYDSLAQGGEAAARRALNGTGERYEFHRPELSQGAHERFLLEGALRRAIERAEFVLHYQPQVSLANGKIIGIEALVRWQHPDQGLISPARFIGLAEETGLILPIGEWVLRRACLQSCEWQRNGLPALPMSVNLSARQFSENIVGTVSRILAETGLEPSLLELELTESASMEDPQKTFEILRHLKDMGVQLAIDDFGTGYSNLSYLKRFPVDKLKLDQSFVRDIATDPHDLSIARAVIAMGHGLGLTVIAEGVETERHLALLAENGCDEIQGYYFSRPIDAVACARLLAEGRRLPPELLRMHKRERTLLLVDDEPNILSALKRQLRSTGLRILTAASGAEGLALLEREPIDVIVSDQRMPGMTGVDFLRAVKTSHPDTVRIVLSGFTELQSVTDAVNEGAIYKFLTKPWDDTQLRGHIQEALLHKEMVDENRRLDMEVRRVNQSLAQANRQLQEVLRQQQEQITHAGISLDIVREALQHMPLPVLGLDEEKVVAFANSSAQQLFRQHGLLLGSPAALFMPDLLESIEFAEDGHACQERLHGADYEVVAHSMGKGTRARGRLVIFRAAPPADANKETV